MRLCNCIVNLQHHIFFLFATITRRVWRLQRIFASVACSSLVSKTDWRWIQQTTRGTLEKEKKKKCWYRSTHTSCIHSEIQQHKHYQFCRSFSGWGPKPVLVLCSRCFSHPAQIWTQVSSIWKQEETPLALTHLQKPPPLPPVDPEHDPDEDMTKNVCICRNSSI